MIYTMSSFYYVDEITTSNNKLDFNEGAGDLVATIQVGSYTLTEFAAAIETAMNNAGALTYDVAFDRDTRLLTISSTSNFTLKVATGTNVGQSAWALMGFTGGDQSGASTYDGDSEAGSEFRPSFWLQDFVSKHDWQETQYGVRNETASGEVEVVRFGYLKRVQFNIVYQNNNAINSPRVESGLGLTAVREFMQFAVTLAPLEINYDRDNPATYDKIRLESTPGFSDGLGYKLRELYDSGLPSVFETGVLVWRVFD